MMRSHCSATRFFTVFSLSTFVVLALTLVLFSFKSFLFLSFVFCDNDDELEWNPFPMSEFPVMRDDVGDDGGLLLRKILLLHESDVVSAIRGNGEEEIVVRILFAVNLGLDRVMSIMFIKNEKYWQSLSFLLLCVMRACDRGATNTQQ